MKIVFALLIALSLTACAGDQATTNRNMLGTSETLAAGGRAFIKDYRARPPCTAVSTDPCRNNVKYAEMQRIDAVVTTANSEAYEAIKANPTSSTATVAVKAALAAAQRLDTLVKQEK